jgi:hypothetical protein
MIGGHVRVARHCCAGLLSSVRRIHGDAAEKPLVFDPKARAVVHVLDSRAYEHRDGLSWSPTLRAEHHSPKNGAPWSAGESNPGALASQGKRPVVFGPNPHFLPTILGQEIAGIRPLTEEAKTKRIH